jgi:hypothetical protein
MTDLFKPGPAIQSLRESDFDTNSAYGEVIDNSIQAGATNIHVHFVLDNAGPRRSGIGCVAFGDDGCGMSADTLQNCLTIGWSSRFNDRDGIGRFGVGMTLGAIHECKRIKIWSKQAGMPWLYTYVDLDEIAGGAQKGIPVPQEVRLPEQFKHLVGTESGTLVLWEKYDRQTDSGDRIRDDFRIWAGRTYRYFIWGKVPNSQGPIRLFIDGVEVKAIDPLYRRTEHTQFPDDPRATEYGEIVLDWGADSDMPVHERGVSKQVRIICSLLPKEWRQRRGDGGSEAMRKRHVPDNEGVSILRNYREVAYGPIPNWKDGESGWPRFEDIDRWWGCEIHFSPALDRAFQTKHIKRGSVPVRELKLAIKRLILPTRSTAVVEIQKLWDETSQRDKLAREAERAQNLLNLPGDHVLAERAAQTAAVPANQLDRAKDKEQESRIVAESYDEYNSDQRLHLIELFRTQPFTIVEKTWTGPQFYEARFLGGNAVLEYNNSHAFWKRLDTLMAGLANPEGDHSSIARELRAMLDIMIIAHAKAEAMFSPETEYTAGDFVDHVRMDWGRHLKSYVVARERMNDE